MKKIMIITNQSTYTYRFRKEIITALLQQKYHVIVVVPAGKHTDALAQLGCQVISFSYEHHSRNPFKELATIFRYYQLLRQQYPSAVLTYTIKPNLYAGLACGMLGIPWFPNITGLGPASQLPRWQRWLVHGFYRFTFFKATTVFFQNSQDQQYLDTHHIKYPNGILLPGSGVNLDEFPAAPYPPEGTLHFLFLSRIVHDKGIDLYLDAARHFNQLTTNAIFHVVGPADENYVKQLDQLDEQGIIRYHGPQADVVPFYQQCHCLIHPSFYPEGMANVLLEAGAIARPLITTDQAGCREAVDHTINGYLIAPRSSEALIDAIEQFIDRSYQDKQAMAQACRRKIEQTFSRQIVVDAYVQTIKETDELQKMASR